jgi:hypothetical protein
MGDARAAASNSDDAAATVAPLAELWRRAAKMRDLQRWARALELTERALEQARRTLPPNNLILAWIMGVVVSQRMLSGNEVAVLSAAPGSARRKEICNSAAASDSCFKAMSLERLAACCARFEAGTLCTPTLKERAFFSGLVDLGITNIPLLERLGEEVLFNATSDAIITWSALASARGSSCVSDEFAVLVAGIKATLQTATSTDARGELLPWLRKREKSRGHLARVVALALRELAVGPDDGPMFSAPPETEAALRRLQARLPTEAEVRDEEQRGENPATGAWQERAAADMARHGLNTCALPTCDAKEPHPRFFKCCSRCRNVFYCSQEHQREDWPRHRRADRCTKAEAS